MIVCHCAVVTDRAVGEAVESGAGSLAQVCRATGAGTGCGGCLFSLRQLLCHDRGEHQPVHNVADMSIAEVAGAAS